MNIEVNLATNKNGFIIKNMYPLYLHDIAGIHGTLPNQYGIFEEEHVTTLQEQYDIQQVWFEHQDELFPYLITVNNLPAGFCLVGSGKYVCKETDFFIYETFLLSPFRGKGISHHAILEVLNNHHGRWMLFTHATENNKRAQRFWKKVISTYTNEQYTITNETIEEMPKLVFKFEN